MTIWAIYLDNYRGLKHCIVAYATTREIAIDLVGSIYEYHKHEYSCGMWGIDLERR